MWKVRTFFYNLKKRYREQAQVVTVVPLRKRGQEPIRPFHLRGIILDEDPQREGRKLTEAGNSIHITIPQIWKDQLKPPLVLYLFQTDVKGIIIQEKEVNENEKQI